MSQQTLTLVWLIAVAAIFYFMIIRPQQQRTKKQKEMQDSVQVGDRVVTIGGLYGTVKSLDDDTMTLQVSDNTKIVFARAALAQVMRAKGEPVEEK